MAQDNEKLNRLLRKAAAEKLGAGELFDQVEKVGPLLKKLEGVDQLIKGDEGYTPQKGQDYYTEEEKQDFLDSIRPIKGVDYMDGEPGKTPIKGIDYMTDEEMAQITKDATPIKGQHYFNEADIAEFKAAVTPKKGVDYNDGKDGKNPSVTEFLDEVMNLKGAAASNFSKKIGAVIDISHIRNAASFMFNGQKYGVEELMHGSGSGGGSSITLQTDGVDNGSQTLLNLIAGTNITLTNNGGDVTIDASGGGGGIGGTIADTQVAFGTAADTIGGSNNLAWDNTSRTLTIGASGTNGTIHSDSVLTTTSVGLTVHAQGAPINLTTDSGISLDSVDSGDVAILRTDLLNDDRQFYFPDASGTLALASDLTGYVPTSRTITVNGSTQDLSADRTYTITTTGTSNRISVTNGATTTPTIDIAATYVGQSSITTVGTLTGGATGAGFTIALSTSTVTGTLGISNGGTGKTSISALSIWAANSANTLTEVTGTAGQSIRVNAGATAWEAYTPTSGTVTSVSGTSNRITSTGGATPVIDIAATYVGQTSITTLGTISTGVWNGTTIAVANGGTGGTSASITLFNNITGYTASGATGTTSTNLVFSTSPSITTPTLNGAALLAENASIALDPVLSADGKYTGTTISGTAGTTLAFGDLVYLAVADSRWELADASAVSTGAQLTGFCVLAAAADGDPTVILLDGNIRADTAFPTLTVGAPVFMSETAGDITNTSPTTTDSVTRVLGYGLTGDSMIVRISPDWITHT